MAALYTVQRRGALWHKLGTVGADKIDAEGRQFMLEFKERMKARFEQIGIWMTTYSIEVL
jgi:hypothetical protein